jgi:hypothetical protein
MLSRFKTRRSAVIILCTSAALLAGCGSMTNLETKARILSEPPCTDFFFPIYFADKSSDLSKAAQGVILNAGKHSLGCQIMQVQVIGLADSPGARQDNLDLSRRRARSVAAALAQAGLPPAQFQVDALGSAGAGNAPLRRRADVYIYYVRER